MAQKEVEVINADLLEFNQTEEGNVRILTGNVILKQDNVILNCNSAKFFEFNNSVEANGNVVVNQADSVKLYCNQLNYWGNEKKLKAISNVKLQHGKSTLYTDVLDYDLRLKKGVYQNGGKLIIDSTVLNSRIGYYYANTGDAYFKKNVKLVNPKYTLSADSFRYNINERKNYFTGFTKIITDSNTIECSEGFYELNTGIGKFINRAFVNAGHQKVWADTIFYNQHTQIGKAFKKVTVIDTIQKTIIKSGALYFDATKNDMLATVKPLLVTLLDKDSIFIIADTLLTFSKIQKDSSVIRKLLAYRNVKFYSKQYQALADSMVYSTIDSSFQLYKSPFLYFDSTQINADTIFINLKNNKINLLQLFSKALIINKQEAEFYNQIKAQKILGYFENNQLSILKASTQAACIYFSKDEKEAYLGVNRITSQRMNFYLKNNEVKNVKFYVKPEAAFYPIKNINIKDFYFKEFVWNIDEKPTRSLFAF